MKNDELKKFTTVMRKLAREIAEGADPDNPPLLVVDARALEEHGVNVDQLDAHLRDRICTLCKFGGIIVNGVCDICHNTGIGPI